MEIQPGGPRKRFKAPVEVAGKPLQIVVRGFMVLQMLFELKGLATVFERTDMFSIGKLKGEIRPLKYFTWVLM